MKTHHLFLASLFLMAGMASPAWPKDGGLSSSDSSQVSGTAGVRGGDVMGRAILKATPNRGAVSRMEARYVPSENLNQFQEQGKLGRYAK